MTLIVNNDGVGISQLVTPANTGDETASLQIRDGLDFPHSGVFKALYSAATGNYALKNGAAGSMGFNFTYAGGTSPTVAVAAGKIFRDGKYVSISALSAHALTRPSSGHFYHLVVVKADNSMDVRESSANDDIPELTDGDIPIGLVKVAHDANTATASLPTQFFTSHKTDNNLSIGYLDSNAYTPIGELSASASGLAIDGTTATIVTTPFMSLGNGATNAGELRLLEDTDNGSHYTGFKAPAAVTANTVYTLPADYPASNKVLQSTDAGVLSWETMSSGATLTGSTDNTIVTVTGANAIAGEANLTFDGTDLKLLKDANNADVSLTLGTSDTEAFNLQVLNGSSNKTAEEIRITTKTASGTANHSKISVYIDEVEILDIDDGGIDLASGKTFAIDGTDIVSSPITALNSATANELVTVGSTTTELDAEANLTFDGNLLTLGTAATTTDVLEINADSVTDGYIVDIHADGLEGGRAINIHSNSSNNSSRRLVNIHNDHASATGVIPLYIRNDSTGDFIILESRDADATSMPIIAFNRNSASPAADDFLGSIEFKGEDSADASNTYSTIKSKIIDVDDGQESGAIILESLHDGTLRSVLFAQGGIDTGSGTGAGSIVLNEDGQNIDTRIEGDADANLFFCDASADKVGIGLNAPKTKLTVEGAITLKEQANADTDTAAYGQLWTKTATPNQLYFTNDAGNDILLSEEVFIISLSDETTDLTTGNGKASFNMPFAMTLTGVKATVNTAPVGSTIIVDINEAGVTILSTKLSIDASELTSSSATSAAVISDASLANDALITFDIDQIGSSTAGKGLKVTLYGYRT